MWVIHNSDIFPLTLHHYGILLLYWNYIWKNSTFPSFIVLRWSTNMVLRRRIFIFRCRLVLLKSLVVNVLSAQCIMVRAVSIVAAHLHLILEWCWWSTAVRKVLHWVWMMVCCDRIRKNYARTHNALCWHRLILRWKSNDLQWSHLQWLLLFQMELWLFNSLIPLSLLLNSERKFWFFVSWEYKWRTSLVSSWDHVVFVIWAATVFLGDWLSVDFTDLWVLLDSFWINFCFYFR